MDHYSNYYYDDEIIDIAQETDSSATTIEEALKVLRAKGSKVELDAELGWRLTD
jgi:biotin operon repressor